jgi:hypothetical protein
VTDPVAVNRDLALAAGFLFAACLVFAALAWMAMNYVESDLERFHRWVAGLETKE